MVKIKISEQYYLKRLASDIYASGVNLAEDRHDWIALMYSMAGGGLDLLDSFLDLASRSSKFKKKENIREFKKVVLRTNDDSLKWLIKKAQELGFNLDDYLTPAGWRDREEWIRKHGRGSPPVLPQLHPKAKMNFIPAEYIAKCRSNNSSFVLSLVSAGILTQEQAERAADLYQLGAMRDGSVIYWQVDEQGRARDGKVMQYGPDCHRLKDHGAQWMGWLMRYKLRGADGKFLLPLEWKATQCLFGEHLISEELGVRSEELKIICVVEAEKTAVILSQLMPDKLWLASGGESQLNVDKLAVLRGRKVILYPDTDPDGKTFQAWQNIANEARRQLGLDISVSDFLENIATPEQKAAKIDIADFIEPTPGPSTHPLTPPNSGGRIRQRRGIVTTATEPPEVITPLPPREGQGEGSLLAELIDTFDLIELKDE